MKFNLLSSVSSVAMGSLVALAVPSAANATLVCNNVIDACSEQINTGAFLTGTSSPVTVDFFVASGGKALTSVVITESGSFITSGNVTYTGGGTGTFTFASTGTLTLFKSTGAPSNFPTQSLQGNAPKQSYTLAHSAAGAYSGSKGLGSTSKTITGASAASFVGTGTFLALFSGTGGANVQGTNSFSSGLTSDYFGTLTITYNYNYPAPEPASLALMGGAIAGLGALRRRRKAS